MIEVPTTPINNGKMEIKTKKKKRLNLLSLHILLCVVGSPGRTLKSR
jgi:hypothetical protein